MEICEGRYSDAAIMTMDRTRKIKESAVVMLALLMV